MEPDSERTRSQTDMNEGCTDFNIFSSEAALVEVLDRADALITSCVLDEIDFYSFYKSLGYIHSYYALDGHESDKSELALFDRYRTRIAFIDQVLEAVSAVCSDEDACKADYILAGRIGSAEAVRRVRSLYHSRQH